MNKNMNMKMKKTFYLFLLMILPIQSFAQQESAIELVSFSKNNLEPLSCSAIIGYQPMKHLLNKKFDVHIGIELEYDLGQSKNFSIVLSSEQLSRISNITDLKLSWHPKSDNEKRIYLEAGVGPSLLIMRNKFSGPASNFTLPGFCLDQGLNIKFMKNKGHTISLNLEEGYYWVSQNSKLYSIRGRLSLKYSFAKGY